LGDLIELKGHGSPEGDERSAVCLAQDKIVEGALALAEALDEREQRLRDIAQECDDLRAENEALQQAAKRGDDIVAVLDRFFRDVDPRWIAVLPFRAKVAVDQLVRLLDEAEERGQ